MQCVAFDRGNVVQVVGQTEGSTFTTSSNVSLASLSMSKPRKQIMEQQTQHKPLCITTYISCSSSDSATAAALCTIHKCPHAGQKSTFFLRIKEDDIRSASYR
jgi:hypothetical protein